MRQISKTRRRLAAGAFLMVAGPVALGSVAYACQSLATLHANPSTAAAGSTIQLYGKNYSSSATSSNIEIRLNARDGALLASFSPRSTLDNVPVTLPANISGEQTLLATQYRADGAAASGTPGRTTVFVTAARTANEGSAASAAAATSSAPVAATPAAAAPAAPAVVTPAASGAAASVASPAAAARTATPAPAAAAAPAAPTAAAEAAAATNVAATPAAPAGPAAPAAAEASQVSVGGLLPAASDSSSVLPGLTLGAGLALVLLSLGAFIKSSRNVRSDGPLAG